MHTRRCTLRGCVSPWRSPLSVGSLSDAQKWNEWACGSTSGSCVSVARSSSASPVCAPRPYVSLFSCRSFPSLCVFVGVEVLVLLWFFFVCVCVSVLSGTGVMMQATVSISSVLAVRMGAVLEPSLASTSSLPAPCLSCMWKSPLHVCFVEGWWRRWWCFFSFYCDCESATPSHPWEGGSESCAVMHQCTVLEPPLLFLWWT